MLKYFPQVQRTNKRRNLTSSQWAAIANEATDIINELERQAKERSLANLKKGSEVPVVKKVLPRADKGKTVEKLAEIFPTNTQYIQQAKRIKQEQPEEFEKVKNPAEINQPGQFPSCLFI